MNIMVSADPELKQRVSDVQKFINDSMGPFAPNSNEMAVVAAMTEHLFSTDDFDTETQLELVIAMSGLTGEQVGNLATFVQEYEYIEELSGFPGATDPERLTTLELLHK